MLFRLTLYIFVDTYITKSMPVMKKRASTIMLLYLCGFYVNAADNLRIADTRTLGMGGQGVAHSAFFNPSLLAVMPQREVRADYFNRYSLQELATIISGLCYPNDRLPFGIHLASFGYDAYRESMLRLSAAKQVGRMWSLGISMQYAILQSELFEKDPSRIAVDIGATFHPTQDWRIAVSIMNFPSVSLANQDVDSKHIAPRIISLGMNHMFLENLLITAGVENSTETPFSFSAGMEYEAFPDFRIRTGIKTNPFCPSLGVSYTIIGLTADVAVWYHKVLGVSTGIGFSYAF